MLTKSLCVIETLFSIFSLRFWSLFTAFPSGILDTNKRSFTLFAIRYNPKAFELGKVTIPIVSWQMISPHNTFKILCLE